MIDTIPTAAFGALAALSLGVTDFLARFATQRLGPRLTGALMYGGGAVLFGALALALGLPFPAGARAVGFAVASGLAGGAGILFFYTALSKGQLAYVIPIAASYPVWSVLYAALVQGVAFGAALIGAIALTLAGAVMVARFGVADPEAGHVPRPDIALAAVAAAVLFVASLYLAEPAVATGSAVGTLALARAAGACLLALTVRHRPGRGGFHVAAAMALLDGLATLLILFVIGRTESALAIVISGAFGVVAVLLGRFVLAEQVVPLQWAGIALALGGAMAVSTLGP